jgi:hypothetical protein
VPLSLPLPLQVFPTAGYEELYTALRRRTLAGGPTYHLASYTVLTNSYQAVFGGWKVGLGHLCLRWLERNLSMYRQAKLQAAQGVDGQSCASHRSIMAGQLIMTGLVFVSGR